ncbi:MAG: hypothetical protein A3K19_16045 [Lentisphaerae bacterium RIFOXYB12_FULL_65_16]|nr:MAG: hypothetical protein A3K18_12980 [Lentisphaerae bacterium RIFOXYA12_64_32]OGV87337.1 MAG: hypothetical protein A3K19_16045 [Lentisphaerae bacterium RIFOXYB12_FULL_65_16]
MADYSSSHANSLVDRTKKDLDWIMLTVLEHPEYFWEGRNLTEDAKSFIADPDDVWQIALIDEMQHGEQEKVGDCFISIMLGHYSRFQLDVWLKKETELLTARLGREPTFDELYEDARKNENFERFRLCYVLHLPQKVAFQFEAYNMYRTFGDTFLACAEILHPYNYPYFEKIWCNSLLSCMGDQVLRSERKRAGEPGSSFRPVSP